MGRIPRVIKVKVLDNYELELTFDDGKTKIWDAKPFINSIKPGTIGEKLKDYRIFSKVRADLGIEWDEIGGGIAPEVLYKESREVVFEEKQMR